MTSAEQITPALKTTESILRTEIIHPCALVNADANLQVRGWNADDCSRVFDKIKETAGSQTIFLTSWLIMTLPLLYQQ